MELYSASGIDRTYISAVERGVQGPTIRMISRFAKYLNVRPSEIIHQMERSRFYSERGL